MADQTPDPTQWSDDQLDNLLDALSERAAERDDLDLPGSGPSRRGVLAGLLGLGGAAAGAGVTSAIGESESYGASTGVVGTDSEPLDEANIQDLHAQDAQIDNLLQVAQVEGRPIKFGDVGLTNRADVTTVSNNGTERGSGIVAFSSGVGTSPSDILNYAGTGVFALGTVNETGTVNRFCDFIIAARGGGVSVVQQLTADAPTRSYSESSTGVIAVAAGSSTLEIGVRAWRMSAPV